MEKSQNIIFGKNAIIEALESGQIIDKIYIQKGSNDAAVKKIFRLSRKQKIAVVQADRRKIENFARGNKTQGVVALIPPIDYVPLENLVDKIQLSGKNANIIIIDRINDPHNFGAIIRSAEVFGADGVVFCINEGCVPVTDVVVKSSAGAVFNMDICKVPHTLNAVKYLKNCGFWMYATSSHCEQEMWDIDFTRPCCFIIGNEGAGIKKSLLGECDARFVIPQSGKTESLNASVAAGVVFAEVSRQRRNAGNI